MTHEPDIFGYLATSKISEITTDLLDDSTKETYANRSNVKFWKGPISIWATVRASRTYPGGHPIPESGSIVSITCAAGDNITIQPPGSEIWRLTGMDMTGVGGTAEAMIAYFDGSAAQRVGSGLVIPTAGSIIGAYGAVSDIQALSLPVILTNSLWWVVTETGSAQNIDIVYSYQKVSL